VRAARSSVAGAAASKWALVSGSLALGMVLLVLPFARLKFDDFFLAAGERGLPTELSSWDRYRFITGQVRGLIDRSIAVGGLPWFTDPELRIALWRPLSSALAAFDDAVFGAYAPAHLLHSGFWYVALCALVAAWYQRHLPGRRGAIAAVGYALAANHQQGVTWFSARNTVVAAVFGMLAVFAHERAREKDSLGARIMVAAMVALALSAGEAGLGSVAFIIAMEWLDSGVSWRVRLRRVLPTLGSVGLYFVLRVALGYGTHASGMYKDPLTDPFGYLAVLPERLLGSLAALLVGMPADLWFFVPSTRSPMAWMGIVAGVALWLWLRHGARRLPASDQRTLRLLVLAMFLSLLPQLAGPLGPRSYTIPSIAALGLLAAGLDQALSTPAPALRKYGARALAGLLLLVHGAVGPYWWLSTARSGADFVAELEDHQAELGMDEPATADDEYVLISVPNGVFGFYTPYQRAATGQRTPAQWRVLSFAARDHVATRTSEHTLEVKVDDGDLLDSPITDLFRDAKRQLQVGQVRRSDGFSARILELSPRGQPRRVEFTTKRALDDPELHLMAWDGGHMRRVSLAPGEQRRFAWQAR